MRKLIGLSAILIALSGCATITPGTATVQVNVCGEMDAADRYQVLKSGRYWVGPCVDHFSIPLREQRAVWTKSASEGSPSDESISFSAGTDGQPLNVDVGIGYQIPANDEDITTMIRTYGPDLEQTIDSRVRDQVRHNLNTCAAELEMTVQNIYGTGKGELFSCAEKRLQEEFNPNGLVVTRLTLNSEIRLPPTIKDAMERAQAATQKADQARRELETSRAEAEKDLVAAEAAKKRRLIEAEAEFAEQKAINEQLYGGGNEAKE